MTYIGSLSGGTTGSSGSTTGSTYTAGTGISGLASGINTDSIVNGLVQVAQIPLSQTLQQRQVLQWQEEQYQRVNSALTNLQSSVANMQLQSTFQAQSVSSSNSSAVSGSVTGLAANGTYQVTVNQLAQGATVASSTALTSNGTTTTSDTTLSSLGYASGVTLNINGQSLKFQGTDTLGSVLQGITANTQAGVAAFYDTNAGEAVVQTTSTGSGAKIQLDQTTADFFSNVLNIGQASVTAPSQLSTLTQDGSIEINGYTVQLKSGDTASDVVNAINDSKAVAATGVTASLQNGQLVLKGSSTASDGSTDSVVSPISVSDPNNLLGLKDVYGSNSAQVAQDASFTVNGYTTTSSSNQATYNGLTLNLEVPNANSTLTVSTDASSVVKSITDFVQQYNTTLQGLQGLYYQKRNYDYKPLTTQQASQMTSTQIDEWNQKAESGMLANDTLLGGVMNGLEQKMSNVLQGQSTNSLAAIGITPIDPYTGVSAGSTAPGVTTSGWDSYGLLQINTAQLTAAVQKDPQGVMNLFTENPTPASSSTSQNSDTTGIAAQLYSAITSDITQITSEAGSSTIQLPSLTDTNGAATLLAATPIDVNANLTSTFANDSFDTSFLGQEISALDSQSLDKQQQISDLQTRYQKEYANLETTMSSLTTQSDYLVGMVSSSSGG